MAETDRIEKVIDLKAPRSRVWRAITDAAELGAWFGAKLEGQFSPGARVRGKITYPGYEHLTLEVLIDRMEPESYFSWRWHPDATDPKVDYSNEPATLVEFKLETTKTGTRLTLVESGFDALPASRRALALRGNDAGWTQQMKNIETHVAG